MLNKVDLLDNRETKISAFLDKFGKDTRHFVISAISGEGCKELTYAIMEYLNEVAAEEAANTPEPSAKSEPETVPEIYNPLANN